jgi:imidazolonepropionase-like amidohydrolase
MGLRRLVAFLAVLAASAALADAPGVYAITGGTVHPVSGPEIASGVVVIRDGLIEAVGANVAIPRDATTIDVGGAHVYPGLIDAQTSLGFAAPARRTGGGGGGGGAAARTEQTPDPTPDSLAIRNAKISDDDAAARRAIGVTTVLTAPTTGVFNGQSVVVNLGQGPIESRVIKSPATMQISFTPRPGFFSAFPNSLMGVIAHIRQTLMDADQHQSARTIYERNPAGLQRPSENPSLEALRPVIRRELPIVFIADSEQAMRRVHALAKEFNLRYIISGGRQGYALANELKNAPVLVSVKWPTAPADKQDREDQPLRVIRDRQLAPTTPSALAKAGVQFALVSGPGKTGDYLPGIRKAVENGLSVDDALRAATISPARILGIDRQLGSLERGKIANVVVSDKPLFDEKAKVTRVFVDGREIRLPADDKTRAAGAAAAAASPIDGTWNLTVSAPEGNTAIQVTLRAEDGGLTGNFSGDRGSGEIRGGTFADNNFEFTITVTAGNESEASDWLFSGSIDGSTMTGTVTSTIGKFAFSGSKPQ